MKNSKLTRVLKTFTKKEFKEFEKFTASPFFSRGRDLTCILKALKKYYPEFDNKNFTYEKISGEIGKKNKASKNLVKLQMSELYKLAEKYISYKGWETLPVMNTYFFANMCKKKGLYDLGESKINKEISHLKETGIDWRHYLNYHFSKVELINFSFLKDKPMDALENISSLSEIILHQFLGFAARYVSNLTFFKLAYNQKEDDNLLISFFNCQDYNALLKSLEQKQDIYSKASRVYLLFILMQLDFESDESYFEFKKFLLENIEIFSSYEKSFFLQSILAKTEHFMDGKEYNKYAEEYFEIINLRLDQNLHKQYPEAPYTMMEYFSALNSGFILNKKEWMQGFKAKYLDEVPEEHRYAVSHFSDIFLKFANKQYVEALQLIQQTSDLPFILVYEVKRLQLMTYYELDMTDEIFLGMDAFKGYLKTNKNVSDFFMESNQNFIKHYLHIVRYKLGEIELESAKVHDEIEKSSSANKGWLLEKIAELKTGN